MNQEHEVRVKDFDMPFGSMIWFMIKWAFASIPALIIISVVIGGIIFAFALVFGSLAFLPSLHR